MSSTTNNGDKLIANMTRQEYKEYVEQGIFPERLKPLAAKLGVHYTTGRTEQESPNG